MPMYITSTVQTMSITNQSLLFLNRYVLYFMTALNHFSYNMSANDFHDVRFVQLFVRMLMSYLCYLCLFVYSGVHHVLTAYHSRAPEFTPGFLVVSVAHVSYDLCIKMMLYSSLLPVVCRRAHVLFTLFMFVSL